MTPDTKPSLGEPAGRSAKPHDSRKSLKILGTRGIPAKHGGFETFAERLSLYLVERDWRVTVYCQSSGRGPCKIGDWEGVQLVHCPTPWSGALGTIAFDWRAMVHATSTRDMVLTLGYNTAAFCALCRVKGVRNVINMDGLEWRRGKWSRAAQAWLFVNERLACMLADHLVADHPEIRRRLLGSVAADKITMIPYGADAVEDCDPRLLAPLGLHPRGFALVVARPEPENSILEIVRAFCRIDRGCDLVILGDLQPSNPYHAKVIAAANQRVRLLGAIYDRVLVNALRSFARLYVHGHTVGGTNPSLLEAMGAASPVLAHDNVFNRWVCGEAAAYFVDEHECAQRFNELLANDARLAGMAAGSTRVFAERFTWGQVLGEYEALLTECAQG